MNRLSREAEDLQRLYHLAPVELLNRRLERYRGGDMAAALEGFALEDVVELKFIYRFLKELMGAVALADEAAANAAISALLSLCSPAELVARTRTLGRTTYLRTPTPLIGQALHDVRGGGLSPLLGQLQLHEGALDHTALRGLFFLARDHLKIMRNALPGLDPPAYQEDARYKLHNTDLLLEKWSEAARTQGETTVQVEMRCLVHANISESCVEFGALDRVLYNVLNNATRHSAGEAIELFLLPLPEQTPKNVRFIVRNALVPHVAAALRDINTKTLFQDGVSTTGSGRGLTVVRDFVAHAYGLPSADTAVEEGYVGASLLEGDFVCWFHWPVAA